MPPIQTTYNSSYAPGYVGMVANQELANIVSRTAADASLAFGVPVFQGPTDHTVTATPGTAFRGISVADKTVVPSLTSAVRDAYAQNDTAAVMTQGVIWVTASAAVTAGEPVFITSAGLFTDVATGDTAVPGATFDTSAASGALVKIRLT